MALVTPIGQKVARTVQEDESVLCRAKYVARQNAASVDVTAATIETTATRHVFLVNGVAETLIGAYTGNTGADNEIVWSDGNANTIQELIDLINGVGVGQTAFNRWRASLGDFRPGYVIGAGDGLVAAAANALLGVHDPGLDLLADSTGQAVAETMSVCLGIPSTQEGTGAFLPSHFESGYTSTVAGVITRVREEVRRREEQAITAQWQVHITGIHAGAAFANNDKRIRVFDRENNLIESIILAAANEPARALLGEEAPIVGPMGSPLWVELNGTGAFTNGPLSVHGYIHVA